MMDSANRQVLVVPKEGVTLEEVAVYLWNDPDAAIPLAAINGLAPANTVVSGLRLRITGVTDQPFTDRANRHFDASEHIPASVQDPEHYLETKRNLDRQLEADFDFIVRKLDESHYSDSDEEQVISILRRWGEERFFTNPIYEGRSEYLDILFRKLRSKTKDVGILTTQWSNYYSLIFNHFDRADEVAAIRDANSRLFRSDSGLGEMNFGSFFWEEVKEGRVADQIGAYFLGLMDAGEAFIKGIVTLVTDPGAVIEAIGKLPSTLSTLWTHRSELWNRFLNASPTEQSRMIGRLFGELEILIATVGSGSGTKAAQLPELATAPALVVGRGGTAAMTFGQGGTISLDVAKLGTEGMRMSALTGQLGGASEASQSTADEIASEASSEANKVKSEGEITPELIDDLIAEVEAERFRRGERLQLTPYRGARATRSEMEVTGQTHQAGHFGPQAALRELPQYNYRDVLTRILPRDVHFRFDSYWKSVFESKATISGTNRITVQELYDVVSESIRRSPDFTLAEQESMIAHLTDELFMQLGLKPDDLVRLPYSR